MVRAYLLILITCTRYEFIPNGGQTNCMKLQLIAGLLVFLVSLPAYAQNGDVEGTVYQRSTEKPVVGADVRIIETEQTQKNR